MSRHFSLKMIGIHLAGILAVATCIALAHWQWSRAHVPTNGEASTASGTIDELNPLRQFLPVASIGATTTIEGTWVQNSRIVLGERIANGEQLTKAAGNDHSQTVIVDWAVPLCAWISDALELTDGSVVQVVRGCSSNPASVVNVSGFAKVTGILQPSEDADIVYLPKVDGKLTTDRIVSQTGKTTHDGYVVATTAGEGLEKVTPMLSAIPHVPLHWRNVFYVFNWLFFAGIVIAMWINVIRDELNDDEFKEIEAD